MIATNDPDDLPSHITDHAKISLIKAKFERDNNAKRAGALDKEKKRRLIGAFVRQSSRLPHYIMFLDSDDYVHRDLVDFVLQHDNQHGYIVKNGYAFNFLKKQTCRVTHNFDAVCGSCLIAYFENAELPENEIDMECYFACFQRHRDFVSVAKSFGHELTPIPFGAVVYWYGHGESISARKKANQRFQQKWIVWLYETCHLLCNVVSIWRFRQKALRMQIDFERNFALNFRPTLGWRLGANIHDHG